MAMEAVSVGATLKEIGGSNSIMSCLWFEICSLLFETQQTSGSDTSLVSLKRSSKDGRDAFRHLKMERVVTALVLERIMSSSEIDSEMVCNKVFFREIVLHFAEVFYYFPYSSDATQIKLPTTVLCKMDPFFPLKGEVKAIHVFRLRKSLSENRYLDSVLNIPFPRLVRRRQDLIL